MPAVSKYLIVGLALTGAALGHFDDVPRDRPMPRRPMDAQGRELTKTDKYLLGKLRTVKNACKEDRDLLCSGARGPEALDCLYADIADVSEVCSDALEGFPLTSCSTDVATGCESFVPMTLGETFDCLRRNLDGLDEKCQAGVLKGLAELGLDTEAPEDPEDTFMELTEPRDDEAEEEPVAIASLKRWKKPSKPEDESDEDCEDEPSGPPATTGAPAETTSATTAAPPAVSTTTAAPVPEGTGGILDPASTAALLSGDKESDLKKGLKDLKDKKKKKRCKKSSGSDSDSYVSEVEGEERWKQGFVEEGAEELDRSSFGRVFTHSAIAGAGVVGVGIAGVAVARKLRSRRQAAAAAAVEQPSQYQEMSNRV